jgi:predicted DNA-binding ribbon-helix-helix protein
MKGAAIGSVIEDQGPAAGEDDLRLFLNNRFACATQLYTLLYMSNSKHTRVQPLHLRDGKYTSFRLEPMFFHALRMIAYRRGLSMSALIREVEGYPRERDRSFASVVR